MPKLIRRQGTATVEFILVLPAFLVVSMFVMEISLMWVDKHYLRLAAFESARILATAEIQDPCGNQDLVKLAKRRAWIRMASVSPPVTEYLDLGKDNLFAEQETKKDHSPILDAFWYLAKRLPVAAFTTQLVCTNKSDDANAVTVELTYFRTPRLPFVRETMWGLYILTHVNDYLKKNGLDGALHFDLDQYYFGVLVNSPMLDEARAQLFRVRDQAVKAFSTIRQLKLGVKEASDLLETIGFERRDYADADFLLDEETINRIEHDVNNQLSSAEHVLNQANTALQQMSHQLTGMLYFVPWQFRFIPMRTSVRVVKTGFKNRGKDWEKGQAFLVAPFNDPQQAPHWRDWALKMSETPTGY